VIAAEWLAAVAPVWWREAISGLTVLMGIVNSVSYFIAVGAGRVRPHMFSWLIWGLITALVAAAQFVEGATVGAWCMIYTALSCFLVTAQVYYGNQAERHNITREDWWCLAAAIFAMGLWGVMGDPFWSVMCVGVIEIVGFIPSFRKSWHAPQHESLRFFHVSNVKMLLSLFVLEPYTITTVFYPVLVLITNATYISMVLMRRHTFLKLN
jgi:hypothetical protein